MNQRSLILAAGVLFWHTFRSEIRKLANSETQNEKGCTRSWMNQRSLILAAGVLFWHTFRSEIRKLANSETQNEKVVQEV